MKMRVILLTTLAWVGVAALLAADHASADAMSGLAKLRPGKAMRASSANPDLAKNGDSRSIEPGTTLVLAELEGPGAITHIWCTVASADILYARSLVIRMYWDGAEKPSVEAPLGDFFGVGHGAFAEFTSLPVSVSSEGRARNCYWRMPFEKSARVTVTNESQTHRTDSFYYYVDWEKLESLPEDTAYFHAQYRQEFPAQPGDYTILETTGRGHYVGTVLSAHQMEMGWFGEGDDRFYVDGEEYPSLSGTGTEDYFCDAWGFRRVNTPYYGVSLWDGYFIGDKVTAYRWHIPDPVSFKRSLKVDIEHRGSVFTNGFMQIGGFEERSDWFSSVAFWYQRPFVTFDAPLPPAAERVAPYRLLRAADFEPEVEPEALVAKTEESIAYMPGVDDAELILRFELEEAGRYHISAVMRHSLMASIYQPILNDKPLGPPLDLYMQGHEMLWDRLGLVDLEAGPHTLRFQGRGLSPGTSTMLPTPRLVEMHALVLLRLEDMAGYKAATKRILERKQKK